MLEDCCHACRPYLVLPTGSVLPYPTFLILHAFFLVPYIPHYLPAWVQLVIDSSFLLLDLTIYSAFLLRTYHFTVDYLFTFVITPLPFCAPLFLHRYTPTNFYYYRIYLGYYGPVRGTLYSLVDYAIRKTCLSDFITCLASVYAIDVYS